MPAAHITLGVRGRADYGTHREKLTEGKRKPEDENRWGVCGLACTTKDDATLRKRHRDLSPLVGIRPRRPSIRLSINTDGYRLKSGATTCQRWRAGTVGNRRNCRCVKPTTEMSSECASASESVHHAGSQQHACRSARRRRDFDAKSTRSYSRRRH